MTDYYWGILVGVMAGYCLSLLTLVLIWSLCVIGKRSENVTDEELEAIKLPDCRYCEGKASVRRASQEWWYVGCECRLKKQCTREFVLECVENWRRMHGR